MYFVLRHLPSGAYAASFLRYLVHTHVQDTRTAHPEGDEWQLDAAPQQQTQETNIPARTGIRTRDPSNQVA